MKKVGFINFFLCLLSICPLHAEDVLLRHIPFGTTNKADAKKQSQQIFIRELNKLRGELFLPLVAQEVEVPLTEELISKRLKDKTAEPLQLWVSLDPKERAKKLIDLLRPGARFTDLEKIIEDDLPIKLKNPEYKDATFVPIDLQDKAFSIIDREQYFRSLTKSHWKLTIDAGSMTRDQKRALFSQAASMMKKKQRLSLREKLNRGEIVSVDQDLLPSFPRRVIGQHTAYPGPNCFHAALSFASLDLAKSESVNVREEPGYHDAMINHDELWRVLKVAFYEIQPEVSPLKFGDIVVFFDSPDRTEVDYKTMRHASVYLTNGFVYSKASKSANTPYTVKTLEAEWQTWSALGKNLGIKVFRGHNPVLKKKLPPSLDDWLQ